MKKIIIIYSIFFSGCDCWLYVSGKIIDDNTRHPIVQAKIEMLNYPAEIKFSDSIGFFKIRTGPYYVCPKTIPIINITKENFHTKKIEVSADFKQQNLKNDTLLITLTRE